jgi:hypothetical protein
VVQVRSTGGECLKLNISDDLKLPLDFVTQTQAILAKKRVGKTYTAKVQAEELLKANQQIVAIDPTGAWWGLKSSADGKHEGFSIAVFGGEHADVPLEETAGETLATALVEQRFSAILDLSLFRKGQINRFMAPFLETLYRLNREAMHLFVDEADSIAPQKPFGEEARMLGAMEDVVRRGGIRGIGTTLITQRPAVINKNVLTQCEILCALRIVHHKDIDAIHEWIAVHGDEVIAKEMIASLPALPTGEAWFWSPGWGDIFKQVKIRPLETFDSGSTPKAGEVKRTAKVLATVDLAKLGQQIAATVQRVKDNDPKELRRKIAELQKQAQSKVAGPDEQAINRAVQQAVSRVEHGYRDQVQKLSGQISRMQNAFIAIAKQSASFADIDIPLATIELPRASVSYAQAQVPKPVARPIVKRKQAEPVCDLTGPEQRILNAIAWLNSIGVADPQLTAVAFLAGYTIGGGAFNNPKGALRSKGLVEYLGERIRLTPEGEALSEVPEGALTPEELQKKVMERLPGPEQKILGVLLENPNGLPNDELAEKAGYSAGGGAFNNPKGRLRSLGLIRYQSGLVVPEPLLFLEGA